MLTSHKLLQEPSTDSQLMTASYMIKVTSQHQQQLVANRVICCPLFVLCMNCYGPFKYHPSIVIKETHDLFEFLSTVLKSSIKIITLKQPGVNKMTNWNWIHLKEMEPLYMHFHFLPFLATSPHLLTFVPVPKAKSLHPSFLAAFPYSSLSSQAHFVSVRTLLNPDPGWWNSNLSLT